MFFLSVFNILRSAFRCAFAYFFCAFACFFCALCTSRFWDELPAGCATASIDHPKLKLPSKQMAANLFMKDPNLL